MENPKGKKVSLRPPDPGDSEEFCTSTEKSRELHEGLVNPPADKEAFEAYRTRHESETNRALLIIENDSGAIAGVINVSQIFHGPLCSAYLGYYLFEGFTGRGLMTEAMNLALRFCFNGLGLHRVEANIQPHNRSSIALVERCGFVKEGYSRKYLMIDGEWRDHERWAAIREDFEDIL